MDPVGIIQFRDQDPPSPRPSPPGRGGRLCALGARSQRGCSAQRRDEEFPPLWEKVKMRAVQSLHCLNRAGPAVRRFFTFRRSLIAALFWLCVHTAIAAAADLGPTNDYSVVEAIFTQHCLDCHGSIEPEAKLVIESHESLMKGGESGAAIFPGKSDESLLVRMIEGRVEKDGKQLIMPPGKKREKLKPEEIALIRAWIDGGAKPPAEFKPKDLVLPRIEPTVPPRNSIHALAYHSGRKWIASGRFREVELRSAETHTLVRTLQVHRGNVNALAFSTDGRFLFAAGGE